MIAAATGEEVRTSGFSKLSLHKELLPNVFLNLRAARCGEPQLFTKELRALFLAYDLFGFCSFFPCTVSLLLLAWPGFLCCRELNGLSPLVVTLLRILKLRLGKQLLSPFLLQCFNARFKYHNTSFQLCDSSVCWSTTQLYCTWRVSKRSDYLCCS